MKDFKGLLLLILICLPLNIFSQTFFGSKIKNETVLNYSYITISYNGIYKIPNYVGEKLTKSMIIGKAVRDDEFYADTNLPKSIRTYSNNFTSTGYDRGHCAPAADFKFSPEAMHQSFILSNIAPQNPNLNRVWWVQIENKVREYTAYCDTLYVITGTICDGKTKIKNNIYVPNYFYKAIIGKKNKKYVISCAWLYQNIKGKQTNTQLTINDLEKKIGYNLFYKMNNETYESKILLP